MNGEAVPHQRRLLSMLINFFVLWNRTSLMIIKFLCEHIILIIIIGVAFVRATSLNNNTNITYKYYI